MIGTTDVPPRRTDRKHCTYCEASAAGCRSNAWLRGRNCCETCTGDHDVAGTPDRSTARERHPAGAAAAAEPGAKVASEVSCPAQTGLRAVDSPTPSTTHRTTNGRNTP